MKGRCLWSDQRVRSTPKTIADYNKEHRVFVIMVTDYRKVRFKERPKWKRDQFESKEAQFSQCYQLVYY